MNLKINSRYISRMDLRLQEWTWGCKNHLVSFKLFIVLMYQGDIRHSIESNTFISLVGIIKFYFSRARKLHIFSVNLYGQLFFYWRKVYHTSVETIHISCRRYIWCQPKIKHRLGNPENICKLGWGSEVWSCGWDWDQIRNPNINNKEIIWLCNYHISL